MRLLGLCGGGHGGVGLVWVGRENGGEVGEAPFGSGLAFMYITGSLEKT